MTGEATVPQIHYWARELGLKVYEDWGGREALADEDAHRILVAIRGAQQESAELHEAHERYLKEWQAQQHAVGEKAFEEYLVDAVQKQRAAADPDKLANRGYAFYGGLDSLPLPLGGTAYAQANNAAAAARDEFKKKNPPQSFDDFARGWKKKKGKWR